MYTRFSSIRSNCFWCGNSLIPEFAHVVLHQYIACRYPQAPSLPPAILWHAGDAFARLLPEGPDDSLVQVGAYGNVGWFSNSQNHWFHQ